MKPRIAQNTLYLVPIYKLKKTVELGIEPRSFDGQSKILTFIPFDPLSISLFRNNRQFFRSDPFSHYIDKYVH